MNDKLKITPLLKFQMRTFIEGELLAHIYSTGEQVTMRHPCPGWHEMWHTCMTPDPKLCTGHDLLTSSLAAQLTHFFQE